MSIYVYSPIESDKSQIRLLTIAFDVRQVLGYQKPKPLSGQLKKYNLPVSGLRRGERFQRSAQLPFYSALSYAWGDGEWSHEILIDGRRLPITANLHAALRDLQASSAVGDLRVWVDAICINQKDERERSAQIPLMREIYHMAGQVCIWLGPSSPEARKCAKFIAHLTDAATKPLDDPADDEPSVIVETIYRGMAMPAGVMIGGMMGFGQGMIQLMDIIHPSYRDGRAKMLLDPDEDLSLHQETIDELSKWRPTDKQLNKLKDYGDFSEIANLISKVLIEGNHWFERMWVVQEVGVAQTVDFQLGNYALSWDGFVLAVHYLHYVRNFPMRSIRRVTGLQKIRLGFNHGKRQPLWDLIRETRSRGATDPRDKIYALLGLMGDPLTELLKPDYSKSVEEVYANATVHFILQKSSLDPICGQQVISRRDQLPSWVPDYSLSGGSTASPLVLIDGRESLYAASGYDHRSKYMSFPRSDPWNELSINGVFLDTVIDDSGLGCEKAKGYINPETWTSTLRTANTNGRLQAFTESTAYWLSKLSSFISKCKVNGQFQSIDKHCSLFEDPPPSKSAIELPLLSEIISTLLLGRVSPRERLSEKYIHAILHCNLFNPAREPLQSSKPEGLKISGNLRDTAVSKSRSTGAETTSQRAPTTQPSEPGNFEKPNLFHQVCQSINENLEERRLIVTKTGYLGVVPQHTRGGDMICVLFGCSVPVVLRRRERSSNKTKKGDHEREINDDMIDDQMTDAIKDMKLEEKECQKEEYTLIGECYLHNFMDAEALVLLVKGERQVQEFILY